MDKLSELTLPFVSTPSVFNDLGLSLTGNQLALREAGTNVPIQICEGKTYEKQH
jgi:hypothetical protein